MRSSTTRLARAAERSQFDEKRTLWIGTSSVCPSTRTKLEKRSSVAAIRPISASAASDSSSRPVANVPASGIDSVTPRRSATSSIRFDASASASSRETAASISAGERSGSPTSRAPCSGSTPSPEAMERPCGESSNANCSACATVESLAASTLEMAYMVAKNANRSVTKSA